MIFGFGPQIVNNVRFTYPSPSLHLLVFFSTSVSVTSHHPAHVQYLKIHILVIFERIISKYMSNSSIPLEMSNSSIPLEIYFELN